MIPIEHILLVSALLFCIGIVTVVIKKNVIAALMGVEMMLNAANINLVAFNRYYPSLLDGQVFALFIIVVAAAEAAVALAIALKVYEHFHTTELDKTDKLQG